MVEIKEFQFAAGELVEHNAPTSATLGQVEVRALSIPPLTDIFFAQSEVGGLTLRGLAPEDKRGNATRYFALAQLGHKLPDRMRIRNNMQRVAVGSFSGTVGTPEQGFMHIIELVPVG